MVTFVRVAPVLVFVVSCGPTVIKPDYAAFHGCDEGEVKVKSVGDYRYQVSGCGSTVQYYCQTNVACDSPRLVVGRRHARQFGCAYRDVRVRALGGGSWMADGCGHALTYQCIITTPDDLASDNEPVVRCIAETSEGGT